MPTSGQRDALGGEQAPEATALIDAASMEGLQARSEGRRVVAVFGPKDLDRAVDLALDTA